MATEPAVVEKQDISPDAPREFGTSLEDIFKEKMPGGLMADEDEPVQDPLKEEPKKVEPKVEKKAKKAEKPVELTDILQTVTPKVEPKVEDDLPKPEAPPELKGKSREHWEKLATEKWESDKKAKVLEKRAKELETKLNESGADARVQQLQNQLKDYSSRLERVGLEHHPWFEANFVAPRNQLLDTAKRALKDAGGDPEAISKALRLEGAAKAEKLDEIFGEISSTSLRGRVERAIDDIDQLDQRKDQVLANRDQVMRSLVENDKQTQKQMFETHARQTKAELAEAKEMLRDKFGFFVLKTVDDPQYAWWNDEVKKMDSEAEKLMLETTDRKELVTGSYLAVVAPRIMNLLIKEVQGRKAAEEELANYKNSEPKLGGGARKSRAIEVEEEDEDKPLHQRILDHIHNNS